MITQTRKALFVMTSHDALTLKDGSRHRTGFYASEFVEPYETFKAAGLEVVVATPDGLQPVVDPVSVDPAHVGAERAARLQTELDRSSELHNPRLLSQVDAADFDLVFVPGGHAPMEELSANGDVGRVLTQAARAEVPVAALCHGPAALLSGQSSDGGWLYAGKQVTGFSKREEDLTPLAGRMQWELEDALRQRGGHYSASAAAQPFEGYAVQDGGLLTGENPASAGLLARKAVQVMEGQAGEHALSFSVHVDLNRGATEVWSEIGRFDALPWHPGLSSGSVAPDGKSRDLHSADGQAHFHEELLESGGDHIRYRMTEGLPVQPVGTLRIESLGAGKSRLTWEADVDTSQVDEATARAVTQGITGFFEAGLGRLQERYS